MQGVPVQLLYATIPVVAVTVFLLIDVRHDGARECVADTAAAGRAASYPGFPIRTSSTERRTRA